MLMTSMSSMSMSFSMSERGRNTVRQGIIMCNAVNKCEFNDEFLIDELTDEFLMSEFNLTSTATDLMSFGPSSATSPAGAALGASSSTTL